MTETKGATGNDGGTFLVYTGPGGNVTATLTTEAPGSHYGIPVLRVEGQGADDWPDLGPADSLPSGLKAGAMVAMWANGQEASAGTFARATAEGVEAARRFCQQWAEGPQVR